MPKGTPSEDSLAAMRDHPAYRQGSEAAPWDRNPYNGRSYEGRAWKLAFKERGDAIQGDTPTRNGPTFQPAPIHPTSHSAPTDNPAPSDISPRSSSTPQPIPARTCPSCRLLKNPEGFHTLFVIDREPGYTTYVCDECFRGM